MGSEINSLHSFLSRGICYELLMLRYVGLGLGLLTRGLQSHRDLLLENLALRARRSLTSRFLPQPIATQRSNSVRTAASATAAVIMASPTSLPTFFSWLRSSPGTAANREYVKCGFDPVRPVFAAGNRVRRCRAIETTRG